jgi:D-aminopeptidase
LTIDGVPIGKEIRNHIFSGQNGDGSVMIVVATDAPLDARQLKRIARRGMLGVARTGSPSTHGSGDYIIAFSTARSTSVFPEDDITPLFEATVEATEEAIYNSLFKATTTTGIGGATAEALPIETVERLLRKYRPR